VPARFTKSQRLLRPAEFQQVFDLRCSQSDRLLVVYARPNQLEHSRLGLVVSRKCGRAVRRNRWKRLLREAFRLHQHQIPHPLDLVVIPRSAAPPSLDVVAKSLSNLAVRLKARLNKVPSDCSAEEPREDASSGIPPRPPDPRSV
jgi:ribonuclease P protein component